MKKFLLRALANMAGIYIASLFFPAISIASPGALLVAGFVLALINLLVRPLLLLICLPINIITLGLFTLVINTGMVLLASGVTSGIHIPAFLPALATAFIIWVAALVIDDIFGD